MLDIRIIFGIVGVIGVIPALLLPYVAILVAESVIDLIRMRRRTKDKTVDRYKLPDGTEAEIGNPVDNPSWTANRHLRDKKE